MSADPAVAIIVGLVEAGVTGVISLLNDDGKASVREQMEKNRARLPAPGSTIEATEAVLAREVAARHPRVTHATADALSRLATTRGVPLTTEERAALDATIPALRAIADAAPLVPPVLDWREPGHMED